ncbi:zinc ribbon domain-containing protein [Halorubrum sp. CSM-61]|uniref:double zinc ribbon domain-containing protein n=1 Tax=Halorubrum sp. CSM-61 TaxID=2485838 RepID=UPI00374334A5
MLPFWSRESPSVECPSCGTPIKVALETCPHCRSAVAIECRGCGNTIETETNMCPDCGGTEYEIFLLE